MGGAVPGSYIQGTCTCGTPYRIPVNPAPAVLKMAAHVQEPAEPRLHTLVFFCPGCGRRKTAEYTDADIMHERQPAGDSEPVTE